MAEDPRYRQPKPPEQSRGLMRFLWLVAAILLAIVIARRLTAPPPPRAGSLEATVDAEARAFLDLEAREAAAGSTVNAAAIAAFRHEDVFLSVWSAMNDSVVPLGLLADFDPGEIVLGTPGPATDAGYGLQSIPQLTPRQTLSRDRWNQQLAEWRTAGWNSARLSVRQVRFMPGRPDRSAESVFAVDVRLTNSLTHQLANLRGDLQVEWRTALPEGVAPAPARIHAETLQFLTQPAAPIPFPIWLDAELVSQPSTTIDPLLSGDLDGDGVPELLLVGAARLVRRNGESFDVTPVPGIPPALTHAAALADLDRDGRLDLVVAADTGLFVMPGLPGRDLFGPARLLWDAASTALPGARRPLQHAQVLAIADIDHDGDLDVFLGQYKVPYQKGQFPTPYFDANDGFGNHLLRNDGDGGFRDVTEASGLAPKSRRRTYSASFVDIDADGHPDLVVMSDFAGLDIHRNDGNGRFTDITAGTGDARFLFGMAHAITDLNTDGIADLYAVGMDSPTAAVLNSLRIARAPDDAGAGMRGPMTAGNRTLLGDGRGGFRPAPWESSIAHGGWAWGVAVADIDNNRSPDVLLANGHETFASPVDYERQFWLHDIYIGSSSNNAVADVYFRSARGRRTAGQQSYGGWQDNVTFLGGSDHRFIEAGWFLGLAHPEDCRNLLAEDLDGDGRLDVVTTTYEQWPKPRQRLVIHRNRLPSTGHWIGLRLPSTGLNCRAEIRTPSGTLTRWNVAGDGYRSQGSLSLHFGLGTDARVAGGSVRWADGTSTELKQLQVDQWNPVTH